MVASSGPVLLSGLSEDCSSCFPKIIRIAFFLMLDVDNDV